MCTCAHPQEAVRQEACHSMATPLFPPFQLGTKGNQQTVPGGGHSDHSPVTRDTRPSCPFLHLQMGLFKHLSTSDMGQANPQGKFTLPHQVTHTPGESR